METFFFNHNITIKYKLIKNVDILNLTLYINNKKKCGKKMF